MSYYKGLIFTTLKDGEHVVERMLKIIDHSGFVSVADLNEMVGMPVGAKDRSLGWANLWGTEVRPTGVRGNRWHSGHIIDLPDPQELVSYEKTTNVVLKPAFT